MARHFCKKGSPIDNEFRRLNAEAGYTLHPWVPDLPPIPSAVADAFLWAKQDLFPGDSEVALDRRLLIRNCLREVEIDTAEEWNEVQASCRLALADSPELLNWFEQEYGTREFTALPRPHRSHRWNRYGAGHLFLDAADFGVRDINGAANLCERLLGYQRDSLSFHGAPVGVRTSLSELQEKEAVIQQLHTNCLDLRAQNEALIRRVQEQEAQLQLQIRALERQKEHIDTLSVPRGWRRLLRSIRLR